MRNLMIDIETFSTKPDAVILSISAVGFDLRTGKSTDVFMMDVDPNSCLEYGLKMDIKTIMWWLKQEGEAREALTAPKVRQGLKIALLNLARFIRDRFPNDVKVWANSPSFDLAILNNAYEKCGLTTPWEFYNERDVRTIAALKPFIKKDMPFEGIKHHPLADSQHQIKYLVAILKELEYEV